MTRDLDAAILSVCLSVCPYVRPYVRMSVTFRYSMETVSHIVTVSSTPDEPTMAQLFYQHETASQNSDGVTPFGGAK